MVVTKSMRVIQMPVVPRFWPKATRLIVLSDEHCGNVAGLTHPDCDVSYGQEDGDEPKYHGSRRARQARQRSALWRWFEERIDAYRPFDVVLNNGDAIDGTGIRSGATELLCSDRDEQVEMAQAVLDFVAGRKADIYMTYGTPYHTGDVEDWEDVLAREVHAKRIEGEGHYDVRGVQIAMKHNIGNTASPASRFTALSNAQIKQHLWALRGQQPKANIIIRSHVHRCLYAGEPGTRSYVTTTPGLQGLGSKYGIRRVDGLPTDFGFLVFDILDLDHCFCMQEIASLEMQRCAITKLP